jgi:glycosyltransferase involved in cell wall biosynthesis
MTNEYEPHIIGGLGVVATNLTHALRGDDMKATVLTKSVKSEVGVKREKNLKIIGFPRNSRFNYLTIRKWLYRKGYRIPDLIHIHSVDFAYLARYYQKKHNVPVVYTCHSLVTLEKKNPFRELMAKRQKILLQSASQIVVPSIWERAQLEDIYPFCNDKITVIENGVNVNEQPQSSANPYHLLFVGRLIRMKGIEELLQAVSALAQKEPKVRLDVVGRGSEQYQRHLKSMARKLGVTSKVRWLGYHDPDQVQQIYSSYGAVIVPSRQESFGLVALEALANGIPLISTRSGGLADFVNEDVAQIISGVDHVDIATAIQTMWREPELTKQRVEEGFKTAEKHDWSYIADRYRELFYTMLSMEGGGN